MFDLRNDLWVYWNQNNGYNPGSNVFTKIVRNTNNWVLVPNDVDSNGFVTGNIQISYFTVRTDLTYSTSEGNFNLLARSGTTESSSANSYIYEVLLYSDAIDPDSTDGINVRSYLNKKWSAYNTLIVDSNNRHVNAITNNQGYSNTVELLKQNSDTKTDKRFISSTSKNISEIQIIGQPTDHTSSATVTTLTSNWNPGTSELQFLTDNILNNTWWASAQRHIGLKYEESNTRFTGQYDIIIDSPTTGGFITNFLNRNIIGSERTHTHTFEQSKSFYALFNHTNGIPGNGFFDVKLHHLENGTRNSSGSPVFWQTDRYIGYCFTPPNTAIGSNKKNADSYHIKMPYSNNHENAVHLNSDGYLRKWRFEGSNDGTNWTIIDNPNTVTTKDTWKNSSGTLSTGLFSGAPNYKYTKTFTQTNFEIYRVVFEQWVEDTTTTATFVLKELKIFDGVTNIIHSLDNITTSMIDYDENHGQDNKRLNKHGIGQCEI